MPCVRVKRRGHIIIYVNLWSSGTTTTTTTNSKEHFFLWISLNIAPFFDLKLLPILIELGGNGAQQKEAEEGLG